MGLFKKDNVSGGCLDETDIKREVNNSTCNRCGSVLRGGECINPKCGSNDINSLNSFNLGDGNDGNVDGFLGDFEDDDKDDISISLDDIKI